MTRGPRNPLPILFNFEIWATGQVQATQWKRKLRRSFHCAAIMPGQYRDVQARIGELAKIHVWWTQLLPRFLQRTFS